MKREIKAAMFAGLVAISSCTFADAKGNKGTIHGKVKSVDGTTITIVSKGSETTIKTDENTKFFLDDKPATLADVKKKEKLVTSPDVNSPATEIRLTSGKKGKNSLPTTAPSPAPTPGAA